VSGEGRPERLWPLFAGIDALPGIGPKMAERFAGLRAETPRDLLFTLPHGVVDRRPVPSVLDVVPPVVATIAVRVTGHRPAPRKGAPARVMVHDERTAFQLVFFRVHGDWLERTLPIGARRLVSGRVELFDGQAQMVHPDHVLRPEEAGELPPFEPVYPLSAGLTQRAVARAAAGALDRAPDLPEWIEPGLLAREGWPAWRAAMEAAHAPEGPQDLALSAPARERLAYDELLAHQLTLALARRSARRPKGRRTAGTGRLQRRVLHALPFRPTGAQTRAMAEIGADMAAEPRMHRLLQGDVGSGKTLVALMALLTAVEAGGQGVLMAPTEILARQHMEGLRPLAEHARVVVELLTGRDRGAERAAKLRALEAGEIGILLGTHAVFQKDVAFADLRLAVIDEQHRFGVRERLRLGAKGQAADVLVMTATPIPRSLALTRYGDMDVSVLDEKPPGRKAIRTALIADGRIEEVVDRLRRAVAEGRRAYWVCPLVEESDKVDMTAAEERARWLRRAVGEGAVGLIHGQMPPAEKDAAMAAFVEGRTQVLVATTVIEVGVNVPEATIMVVEGAENFGLAQLHQLRGRVGRGTEASTCLLMFRAPLGETARRRLQALRDTEDGFRLAEEDLALRGAGDLIGTAQSGLPRFRVADAETQGALLATAQSDARLLLHDDPELTSPRGEAARTLLWLMEQDKGIRLLSSAG
jgi:ATP-dependent DNA helicase RecG